MSFYGPDTSSFQPGSNWAAVKAAGNAFGISKATQGTGYTNPDFAHDMSGLGAAGMVRGAYHFGTPKAHAGTAGARAEASHYAAVVRANGGLTHGPSFQPILDLEGTYIAGFGAAALSRWALDWFQAVNAALGTSRGIVYANYYDARDQIDGRVLASAGIHLWLAAYTGGSRGATPPGWPGVLMQQFTDHAVIPGIAGPCDRSIVFAELAPLLASGSAPSPSTTPGQHWSAPVAATDPVTHRSLTLNTHVDVWFSLGQGQHDFAETIAVQYWLNTKTNAGLQLDGAFGPATAGAVRTFQSRHGLPVTGVVDGRTAVTLGITTP